MTLRMLSVVVALLAGLALSACQTTAPEPVAVPEVTEGMMLSADEVAVLVPGNTFAFQSSDGVWVGEVTFNEDGTESGSWRNVQEGRSGDISGPTWVIDGDQKCTTREAGTECYRYARDGNRYLEISVDTGEVVTIWQPVG